MLIGIGGATLSGKTTTSQRLCEVLRRKGYSVALIPEFTNEVAGEMGFENVDKIRRDPQKYFEFEFEILKRKIRAESKLIKSHDFVICDTTTAEIAFYSKQYLPSNLSQIIIDQAKNNIKRYNLIFLLEPLNVPPDNDFRSKRDITKRMKHYQILKDIYAQFTSFIELPATTLEERIRMIVKELTFSLKRVIL